MIKKIKPLSPTLRQKKRYLVFETISEEKKDFELVNKLIIEQCSRFLGEIGMAQAGILILQDKFKEKKGMIKVNHRHVHDLKAALALIKNEDMIFRSVGVSGILKKAENKFMAS